MSMLRLCIEGTKWKDSLGRAVTLRGINYSTFQYKHPPDAGFQAGWFKEQWFITMRDWGINIARIPFNPVWTSDPAYLTSMDWIVDKCEEYGFYVILDCHEHPSDKNFWYSMWEMLAARYGPRDPVIFDIFNEPGSIQAQAWCPDAEWPSTAQECINRIRRIADNVILLGSRDFCKDANSIAVVTGTNIVTKLHIYLNYTNVPTLIDLNNLLERKGFFDDERPVFVAETGAYANKPNSEIQILWLEMALTRFTELGWSFTQWVWNPSDGAPVIERDYVTATPAGLIFQKFLPVPDPIGGEKMIEYENTDAEAQTLHIGKDETIINFVTRETHIIQPGERVEMELQAGERIVRPPQ